MEFITLTKDSPNFQVKKCLDYQTCQLIIFFYFRYYGFERNILSCVSLILKGEPFWFYTDIIFYCPLDLCFIIFLKADIIDISEAKDEKGRIS